MIWAFDESNVTRLGDLKSSLQKMFLQKYPKYLVNFWGSFEKYHFVAKTISMSAFWATFGKSSTV